MSLVDAPALLVALLAVPLAGSVHATNGRVRQFLEDYGLLVLAVGVAVVAVAGIALFFVGDEQFMRELIRKYGLLALLFVMLLEGAMLLYFAPSEAVVPVSVGLLYGSDPGLSGYVAVIGIAILGATVGQFALFSLAKRGGREYLLAKPWFRVSEDQLDRFDGWFQRYGRWAVPLSNTLPFTRGMLTVPAGLAEMRDWEFVALSAVGTLVFETVLALVGVTVIEYLAQVL